MDEAIEWVEALPESDRRGERDRDAAGLRDRGLRRRRHARAARAASERLRSADSRSSSRSRDAPTPTEPIEAVWRIESARLIAGAGADRARRGPGRGAGAGRARRRARAVARVGRAGQPGRLAHGHREAPRHRPAAAQRDARAQAARSSPARSSSSCERGAARTSTRALDDHVGDDLLRLIFIACHPVLSTRGARRAHAAAARRADHRRDRARVPRARADGRAADRARQAHAGRGAGRRSRCPRRDELAARLASVLEVIYLIFNEGYAATAGDDWMRPALCEEALRLGRILAGLAPDEPEVHGLVALMEIQASRLARAGRARRRAGAAARPGPRALGPAPDPPRPGRARRALSSSAARSARTRCRRRSPPATRARQRPRRPTGRASPRSTTRWRELRRRRWSS